MRRNRKNSIKKERIIMIASSVFVLTALTMTGIYLKEKTTKAEDDGYNIDFSALENNVDNKYGEMAKAEIEKNDEPSLVQENPQNNVLENDLDYLPMEDVGSAQVENPEIAGSQVEGDNELAGLIGGEDLANMEDLSAIEDFDLALNEEDEIIEPENQAASTSKVTVAKELHFSGEQGLIKPVQGNVLMHYNMENSIYFATLDQYKYNPAVMIAAAEGDAVSACAQGKVINVYENEEIGKAVTLELGDGYQATYGQLKEVAVKKNSYVEPGDLIGHVAAPTKYFSMEGTNVYFQLTKDGSPVNPETMFQ